MTEAEESIKGAPKEHLIAVEFYSRRGNKDELLINGAGAPFDAKSRWFSYAFARPVFLTSIEITCEGYASYDKFDVEVDHVDGTRHEERIPVNGGTVRLALGKLATAFRFRPDKKWLSDPKILKVTSTGYSESEFHEFEWAIKEFHKKVADIERREKRLAAQQEELAALKVERTELESAIGKAKAESEQLTQLVATTKATVDKLQSLEKDLRQKNSSAQETLRNQSAQIEKESQRLQELVREVRLFPSEIAGFVKEGNRSISTYVWIGLPFLVVLITILVLIFVNAVNLTQIYKEVEDIDIWTIFLTRIPFVLVAIALIEASGYVVGRLVFEVIRINRQRVEFAKLSIIAKDVSAASAAKVGEMSDREIFDAETQLKMELLREHMKNYVGSEFEYKGTGLIAAIKGVADRISRKPSE
jgi:hypothetical protein